MLSSIIPISLRVNLDIAKLYYSYLINNDPDIPQTIARNSNIPEELGRIGFLLTDKTGTLTKNEMTLIHIWMNGIKSWDIYSKKLSLIEKPFNFKNKET